MRVGIFFTVFGGVQPHWKFFDSYLKTVRNFGRFGSPDVEFAEKFCTLSDGESNRNAIIGYALEGFDIGPFLINFFNGFIKN